MGSRVIEKGCRNRNLGEIMDEKEKISRKIRSMKKYERCKVNAIKDMLEQNYLER